MTSEPDPFDEIVLDEDFVSSGVKEPTADERIEQARRIARSNDRLRASGEISDGSCAVTFPLCVANVRWFLKAANPATALPLTLKTGTPYEIPCSASGTISRMVWRTFSRVERFGSSRAPM